MAAEAATVGLTTTGAVSGPRVVEAIVRRSRTGFSERRPQRWMHCLSTDVAVVKVDLSGTKATAASLALGDPLEVGQTAVAILDVRAVGAFSTSPGGSANSLPSKC